MTSLLLLRLGAAAILFVIGLIFGAKGPSLAQLFPASAGYVSLRFYGTPVEGEPIDFVIQRDGYVRDNRWLADQLRQIADKLERDELNE